MKQFMFVLAQFKFIMIENKRDINNPHLYNLNLII